MMVIYMFAAAVFNGFSVRVVKYSSATTRVVTEQLRVVFVWIFFLLWDGPGHEEFNWI